jgi:hypothetical protein
MLGLMYKKKSYLCFINQSHSMKKFLIYTGIFWSIIFYIISKFSSNLEHTTHYFLIKNNATTSDLFNELLKQKNTNGLFQWCCDCIQFYAVILGYSYEELNIVIFVILQPAIIIYLLTLCVYQYFTRIQKG